MTEIKAEPFYYIRHCDFIQFTIHLTINFTKISLKFCSLHHPAIINLSRTCPNLTTFEFDLSTMKLDYDDEEVTSSTFDACARAVAKYCIKLEVLKLSGWDITAACMSALSTLTSLKELHLSMCSDLSSEPIQAMLRALPGLAKLSLDEIPADEALLRCVGESCHNLTYLRLTVENCGQVALETMIRACPLLEDVNLGPDVDHADAVLVALSTYETGAKCGVLFSGQCEMRSRQNYDRSNRQLIFLVEEKDSEDSSLYFVVN